MEDNKLLDSTENNELFEVQINYMTEVARISNNFPDIIDMKRRIEDGNVDENVIKEWLILRKERDDCSEELKEMREKKENVYKHPFLRKFSWLMVNYIYGKPKRLNRILEYDINTQPKDEEILYNSIKSQKKFISVAIKNEGVEKWKDKIEIDRLLFPNDKAAITAELALNNILSKATIAQPITGNKKLKQNQNQLLTKLTDLQRERLYDLLVENEFIAETTDKKGFIWAFGGKNEEYTSFSIEWLKEKNLAVYLIDTLFYDKDRRLQSNYMSIACKMFGYKEMLSTRNGYKNNEIGVPFNYEKIDTIIAKAKK